jgi:pimeloyl-ACP methyl ester carboxylesterase
MIALPDEPLPPAGAEQTDPRVITARLEALLSYRGMERLRRIRCPTLVLAAADDILIPPHMSRALAEQIAGAEIKVLPNGGHGFPRSRAADYNRTVLEFLLRHVRRQTPELTAPSTNTPLAQEARS